MGSVPDTDAENVATVPAAFVVLPGWSVKNRGSMTVSVATEPRHAACDVGDYD